MPDLEVFILGVLVLVTAYYAVQTRQTVKAMEAATRAQQMPRLVMQVASVPKGRSDGRAAVWVWNDGNGPAIDAFLTIRFIPPRATNVPEHKQDLRVSVIAGDVRVEVNGPPGVDGEIMTSERMCQDYDTVRLEGQVMDSLGKRHQVHQELKDLRALALRKDAGYFVKHERTLAAIHGIGAQLFGINQELEQMREELAKKERGAASPPTEDEVPF